MSMYKLYDAEAFEHDVDTVPDVGDFEMVEVDGCKYWPVDRDALLALADEMDRVRSRCEFCNKESGCDWADETMCLERYIDDYARRIREACGVVR